MRALLKFSERTDVRDVVSRATEFQSVQGVIVDYDPLWMTLWMIRGKYGDAAVDRLTSRFFDWLHFFSPHYWPTILLSSIQGLEEVGEREPPDPNWIPGRWLKLRRLFGIQVPPTEPFIVKICLLPWDREERLPELGHYPFPIVKERRSVAELAFPMGIHRPVIGGVSIGTNSNDSGTLGGIVKDQSRQRWGVTCAHVVGGTTPVYQPAWSDNGRAASRIGWVQLISNLIPSGRSTPCNPYNQRAGLNSVDAALIKFDDGIDASLQILNQPKPVGVRLRQDINPGELVDITGKQSGSRVLEVGGLGLTYRMRDTDKNYFCFHHLFELRWPRWWRVMTSRPVQRGDSGAWVLTSGIDGSEWAGMAIAGDRLIGYAIFAEEVVSWAKRDHKLDLVVA